MPSIAQVFGWSEEVAERLVGDYLNQHVIAVFSYAIYTMLFVGTMRQISKCVCHVASESRRLFCVIHISFPSCAW